MFEFYKKQIDLSNKTAIIISQDKTEQDKIVLTTDNGISNFDLYKIIYKVLDMKKNEEVKNKEKMEGDIFIDNNIEKYKSDFVFIYEGPAREKINEYQTKNTFEPNDTVKNLDVIKKLYGHSEQKEMVVFNFTL